MSLGDTIIYGKLSDVQAQIDAGANVHELDEYGYPPLAEAAIVNKLDIAEYLLGKGVEVDKADLTGRTALFWAAENNNLSLATMLLDRKADPNAYTVGCQPVLVNPLLRNHLDMKKLLVEYGADLNFARDYINTKILSHLFMLQGVVDIYTPKHTFVELALEGFILEFTLAAIHNSINRFLNHYSARELRPYFRYLSVVADRMGGAAELIRYQQYSTDRKQYLNRINTLFSQQPLLIPLAYEGHAISFVQFGDLWARCDRGEYGRKYGCINIYRVNNMEVINPEFYFNLIYTKQSRDFITTKLDKVLQVEPLTKIDIGEQTAGNCSWANIEGSIPIILYFMFSHSEELKEFGAEQHKQTAMYLFEQWRQWQQDMAIEECIASYYESEKPRQASKAALLGAILMQQCHFENFQTIKWVDKIVKILMEPDFRYILQGYYDGYCKPRVTPGGKNLINILESCGVDPDQFK